MNSTLAKSLALVLLIPAIVISRSDGGTGRYKVFKIDLERDDQLKRLSEMERDGLVDVWRHPDLMNLTSDLMVDMDGESGKEFKSFLRHLNVKHSILVDDIESFLQKHWENEKGANIESLASSRLINCTRARRQESDFGFPMGRYYSYNEIVEFMRRVESSLSIRAQIRSIGNSVEGRQILGIELGEPNNMAKRVVWIDGGIHAREWTSVHTAMYFINHIANEMLRGDGTISRYLQQMNIIIFPCLNPDGYEYTRSNPRDALVRLWRKNRSMEQCISQERCCRGVDLNRNFDFRFAETGTSYNPCSEIFHGAGAFSEPESQAVRDAIINSNLRGRLVAFINMHAYSQLWIYPFSHIKHSYPADIAELKDVARKAVGAIEDKFGGRWMYGTGPEIIYAYAGGSADWAKQTAGIKYTYTIELRPIYHAWNGFVLDASQLIPAAQEAWEGVMVVLEAIANSTPSNSPAQAVITTPTAASSVAIQAPSVLSCADTSQFCKQWIVSNPTLCRDSPIVMNRECRRSCRWCS